MDELLSINVPWSQGTFLVSSSFGLSLLPLAFSLILTVASRLLHPYSTDDKTSRLMVKRFSTVRDTQRGSRSYTEKRKGRREIEVARRRGEIKSRESNLAGNQFPICSLQSGTPERFMEFHREERREEGEIKVTRRRGGEIKRREANLASDQFPKCSPQPGTPKEIHRVN